MQVVKNAWILVEQLGCFCLYYNGLYGSAARWTFCKTSNDPAIEEKNYTTKGAAQISMRDATVQMIKNKLGRDTLLTQRQQSNLLKKAVKR